MSAVVAQETMQEFTDTPALYAGGAADHLSQRYQFIDTARVVEALRFEGFEPVRASQTRSVIPERRRFARHMVVFRIPDQPALRKRGDIVPEIVLFNAHDGTSAYRLNAGVFRMVCENGLVVSEGDAWSLRVPHTQQNTLDAVIHATHDLASKVPELFDKIDTWKGIELSDAQRLEFANAAMMLRWPKHQPYTAAQVLQPRRHADQGNDLWRTMNTVQEWVIRAGAKGVTKNGKERKISAVRGIKTNADVNLGIWQLAANYAQN